jgi:hypothetical protein
MPVKVEIDYSDTHDDDGSWAVKVIDVESGIALEFNAKDIQWPWPDENPEKP